MKSFKNILVVAEDDASRTQELLRPAIELAAPTSGVVTLLSLRTRSSRFMRSGERRSSSEILSSPLHRLYDPGSELRQLGVPVHHETARGVPHLEILERIAVYGHDLVIIRGESDIGRSGISARSTAARVLRSSPAPVWIQPDTGQSSGPIAVAVGPKDAGDPDDHLTRKLIDTGVSMARSLNRDLLVVHAWRLDGETMMRSPRLAYQPADIERMAREAQFEARMRVEELLADANVVDVNTRVRVEKGHVSDVLASLSQTLQPAVLVMGTDARQGIQGLVVGNRVERVTRRSESPVLAVRSDGSVSPRMAIEEWTPQALPY